MKSVTLSDPAFVSVSVDRGCETVTREVDVVLAFDRLSEFMFKPDPAPLELWDDCRLWASDLGFASLSVRAVAELMKLVISEFVAINSRASTPDAPAGAARITEG